MWYSIASAAGQSEHWSIACGEIPMSSFSKVSLTWGSGPLSNSLGPPVSISQTASRSVQPFMHGPRSLQTDRPTDHATTSVAIGRIYLMLRCGLKQAVSYTRNELKWQTVIDLSNLVTVIIIQMKYERYLPSQLDIWIIEELQCLLYFTLSCFFRD